MSLTAGVGGLYVKEVKELVREKRLFFLLFALGLLYTIPFTIVSRQITGYGQYAPSFGDILEPVVFTVPFALLLLSLTFSADAVSKERDSGMIGLVMSAPVASGGLILAKLGLSLTAYAVFAAFFIALYGVFSLAMGFAVLKVVVLLFLIPFLALHLFLTGVSLVVSVLLKSSKTAVGVALAIFLPLFLLMPEPPGLGFLIAQFAPGILPWLAYNPLWMGIDTAQDVLYGSEFAWAPVIGSAVAGLVLVVVAHVLLERQEVGA